MTKQTERKSVITTAIEGDKITFDVKGAGTLVLDLGKAHEDVRRRAMVHGFIQRVSDKAAIARNTDTGLPVTPQEKLEAMRAMVDHFMSGTADWNIKRAEGAGRKSGGLDFFAVTAVGEVLGKKDDEVIELIKAGAKSKGITQAQFLAALASSSRVAPVLARWRASQTENLDGDELLEGLGE